VIPQPYTQLDTLDILALCVWREARGEQDAGQRGVAHVCRNRTFVPFWWNGQKAGDYHAVILQPYQFSSFNWGDPNEIKWPDDNDPSFLACKHNSMWVPCGVDEDNTDGATDYYDTSIPFPPSWGNQADYENTLNTGRLRFWKLKMGSRSAIWRGQRNTFMENSILFAKGQHWGKT
jgi:hypothetical protein